MRFACLVLLPSVVFGEAVTVSAAGFDDVRPILERHCIRCHNPVARKGGLSLVDARGMRAGGNTGRVIAPGDTAGSRLVRLVAGQEKNLRMPPEGETLSADEVARLRAWIDGGADWPKDVALEYRTARPHWAFQPIRDPQLPAVKNAAWVHNGIDRFILARLEKEGIAPSPEAPPETLIRRVTLDLIGLPPTIEEIDAFLEEYSAKPRSAYEKLIDRLLASPTYGERWGRHWLDAARYADSDGYEKDSGRPWAWRYRDWVIDALNRDVPFDQFTVEQLAGDLLPAATTEQKIATGFHRNTLTNKEGGVDPEEFRVAAVVDRASTTAKVWLGLTLNCCQCHDHKYDPLTQREFYQFFAFFDGDQEVDIDAPLPSEAEAVATKRTAHAAKRTDLQKAVNEYRQAHPTAGKADPELAKRAKALADHDKTAPAVSKAPTLRAGPTRKTHLMVRGDFLRKGVEVSPDVPAVLPPLTAGGRPTRLDLARWLVAPQNPLTRRVLVNWVWQKYFGRGLVATPEDFGTQGERPSHPELLDWLASRVVEQKWSLKELHRLIVTSATYRQSSQSRPELRERDAYNVLLSRQSRLRLEAEALRDSALAASGLLARKVGGPSVRPPQPPGIAELTYAGSARWIESVGPDRYRRGLYTWFQRTSPYPMLLTFDAPDGVVCAVRRARSNTPLQALTLMNDVVFVECARELGRKLMAEKGDVAEKVAAGFRTCVARQPTRAEQERLTDLFADLRRLAAADPVGSAKLAGPKRRNGADAAEAAAWVALARVLLNLDEFVTRE
jgi:hypothetical protein